MTSLTTDAEATAAEDGLEGDVAGVAAACPKTVLHLGIFFDGTWNNTSNALEGGGEGSFSISPTNVQYLYDVYKNGADYRIPNFEGSGICHEFRAEYIAGIGTTTGESDSVIGGALGIGSTGVGQTVTRTVLLAGRIMSEVFAGSECEEVIIDVFGFSRGATAAREFINAIRSNSQAAAPLIPFGPKTRIRFAGVFDTVASIVTNADYDWGINLDVDEGKQGTKFFHVTADNEYRINFPLNSFLGSGKINPRAPGSDTDTGGTEHRMPGAHGDVGGSYKSQGDLAYLNGTLTRQHQSLPMAEGDRAYFLSADFSHLQAAAWIEEGWINPDEVDEAFQTVVTNIETTRTVGFGGNPIFTYSFQVSNYLYRPWVKLGLSTVSLHAVHHHGKEAEVPFLDFPNRPQYRLNGDLQSVAASVKAGAPISPSERRRLIHDYVHVSANPNSIGMDGTSNRIRVVYPNRPGNAR